MPPPIHGSSVVGMYLNDSKLIAENYSTIFFNLSTSQKIDEIGRNPINKIGIYLKLVFKILRHVITNNFDLIYIAPTVKGIGFYKDFLVVFLAKFSSAKLVFHLHNKGVSLNQEKLIDNFLYKLFFKNVSVILLSRHLYSDVKKYVVRENINYCPNGIPLIAGGVGESRDKNGRSRILFLSNLIVSKGITVLLEACQILKTRGIEFYCVFVGGEGDIDIKQFNTLITEKGLLDCVEYLGKKYGSEKQDEINLADIFVLPTYYHNECLPLVLLEAMQNGLPIISTFEGGITDIVEDGITGFLVQQKNAEQLADKLEILIQNQALREQMGRAGREKFLREYTLEKFENRMVEILNAVTDNKH
jgi:glycosyltransferase involved in cell wall biosynthesis